MAYAAPLAPPPRRVQPVLSRLTLPLTHSYLSTLEPLLVGLVTCIRYTLFFA
jgi:hypothetical protein